MKYNLLSIGCTIILIILIVTLIFKQVKENFSQYNPVIQVLKENIINCFPELGNLKIFEGDKSYTINKEKIYLCIRDKHGQYYSQNILMYVLLHEVAHTICPEIGHTQEFKNIFNSLLDRANAYGIYTQTDIPKDYCME